MIPGLKKIVWFAALTLGLFNFQPKNACAQKGTFVLSKHLSWGERMALSQIHRDGDSLSYNPAIKSVWNYDKGTYLKGIEAVWRQTHNPLYFNYIKKTIDSFITLEGSIRTYKLEDYNLDQVNSGKLVLLLYRQTKEAKYQEAASLLRKQIEGQPRTHEGGFWHKQRYPWQMWLDGIYMCDPFYAQFSLVFNQPQNFNDVADQVIWINSHTKDPKTGLLYHAWDESKTQRWANKVTGCSPNFWGRSIGWYMMAIVDVLDYLPADHPKRGQIIDIFKSVSEAIVKVQDVKSGVWFQLLTMPGLPKNYLEASGSSMFVYSMAKAVNKGYLEKSFIPAIQKGYQGMLKTFIRQDGNGVISLTGTCRGAGLGGNPYRDGSVEYYLSEPVVDNDLKGLGPFIMACVEMYKLNNFKTLKGSGSK